MSPILSDQLWELSQGPLNSEGLLSTGELERERDWQHCATELLAVENLDDNWDGEGAPKIDKYLLTSAYAFLERLHQKPGMPVPSRIIPTQDGEILFEWQLGETYIEAVIPEPFYAEWMYVSQGEAPVHWHEKWGIAETEEPQYSSLSFSSEDYRMAV